MQSTAVNGDAVGEVEIYQSPDGSVRLDVRTDGDTVWLTRQQIGDLFSRDVKTIGKHVANARREELADQSVVAKFATTAADGKTYKVEHYNLDMVLSIGYRVKSPEGIQFRRWANDVLNRYVITDVATNEARLNWAPLCECWSDPTTPGSLVLPRSGTGIHQPSIFSKGAIAVLSRHHRQPSPRSAAVRFQRDTAWTNP